MRHIKSLQILWMVVLIVGASAGKSMAQFGFGFAQWNPGFAINTSSGNVHFNMNQTIDQLVIAQPAAIIMPGGVGYQWEVSYNSPIANFVAISGATSTTCNFTGPWVQDLWFRLRAYSISNPVKYVYSNVLKINYVSVHWENLNYVREHDVEVTGQTTWRQVDGLPTGQKIQTTTYLDGLGRSIESVSKQTATPAAGSTTWGDKVAFSIYDSMGRQPRVYLPYTTASQSGLYKTSPVPDQSTYYSAAPYNETSAYSNVTYDNTPLNRIVNVKEPGASWAASAGTTWNYDMNTVADNVQIWAVDYTQGDAPVDQGVYAANTLYKNTTADVNGNQVITFTDVSGKPVLKKVQAVPSPADPYTGWICTYYVYDDFDQLRAEIEPEGVKYLYANSWSFSGANGATVLAEQVFQYYYDDRGRATWSKKPGSAPVNTLYDIRDRVVFVQDGNQAALSTPQWTATLYDDLDRIKLQTLYNTTESIASLQSDIANAMTANSVGTPPINLTVTTRNTGISTYTAQNSITFQPNFTSATNDAFSTDITSSANVAYSDPISAANLNNPSVCTILKYLFYDNYNFTNVKTFDNNFTNTTAYSTSDPNVIPITPSQRTFGMPTGAMVRILGSSTFLASTNYYDEKGDHIQTLADNIKTGVDITTEQYYFDSRVLSVCNSHTNVSAGYTSFITLTKNVYDLVGRLVSTQKQLGSNPMVTVASYTYDDMGRLQTKTLAPGYTNPTTNQSQLESLNYSFNIHNQLTGINKDYALKTSGSYNKWGHYFGLYLGYDNKDNAFSRGQLNGQIAGQMWTTMGDEAQRKYEYTYDNAARLINATFNQQQHPGDGWSNGTMDFSVSGTSGQITYDNNGNLLTMLQKGVIPGQSAPQIIDDLRYTYNSYSNKLSGVTDAMTSTNFNGISGDFKDGANAAGTPDYVYDNNGNVVVDLNRNLQSLNNGAAGTAGVHYNYMDKPDQIRIPGKGTVLVVYDAEGRKLQRAFVPDAGGSGLLTTYINQFTYQETATLTVTSVAPFSGASPHLAYINFEEGRIRVMTPTSTNNGYDGLSENGNITLPAAPGGGFTSGAWDYFIKDNLENVRMILTEETHSAINECTMELTNNRPAAEDPVFGQTGSANEVETTRANTPTAWTGNTTASVSDLGNLAGHTLGPNSLQKVMAGDLVTASVQYYYAANSNSSNPNIVNNLLANLSSLIGNGPAAAGTLVHGAGSTVTSNLNGVPGFVNAVQPDNYTSGTPQAYITILFFDERFNFIAAADGGVAQAQVRSADAGNPNALPLTLNSIQAPRNGYAYIYISNRSDQDVYFDNLTINVTAGNIIEENHYYAYGLKIAAISSKKLGDGGEGNLTNNYQFQGVFAETDADIGWQDYDLRQYDAQIGRWEQQDPYDQCASPYVGMGADPINGMDPSGGITIAFGTVGDLTGSVLLDRLLATAVGAGAGYGVDKLTGGTGWTGAVVGAGVGLAITFIPQFDINVLLGKNTATAASVTVSMAKATVDVLIARTTSTPDINVGPPPGPTDLNLPKPVPAPAPPPPAPAAQPTVQPTAPPRPAATLAWVETAEREFSRGVEEAYQITKTKVVNGKKVEYQEGCNCGVDVDKYLNFVGAHPGTSKVVGDPWCAAFVNWVLDNSHLHGTGSAAAMSFYDKNWGQDLGKKPAVGAIGVLEYKDKRGNVVHHVTFIVGKTKDGRLVGLGGNQGDKVGYSSWPLNYFKTFRYPTGMVPNYNLPTMNAPHGGRVH